MSLSPFLLLLFTLLLLPTTIHILLLALLPSSSPDTSHSTMGCQTNQSAERPLPAPTAYYVLLCGITSCAKNHQTSCKNREKAWHRSAQERLHLAPNCLGTFARFVTSQTRITYPGQCSMLGKHMSSEPVQHPSSLQENCLATSSEWETKKWIGQRSKKRGLSG